MRTVLVSVLLLATLIPFTPPAAAAPHTVAASNFVWTPSSLTIDAGDTVTFTNEGGSHTWERTDATDSCSLPCTRTFATEGTVTYRCGVHASMTGTIVVGSAPLVAILSPAEGATLTGTVRVEGVASHASSPIASVTLRLGSASVNATIEGPGTNVTWSADVPTTQVANGLHTLEATARTASDLTKTVSIAVTINNPPTIDMRLLSVNGASAALTSNSIFYQLRNDGNAASPVDVRIEYLYHDEWRLLADLTHATLAPGATGQGSFTWTLDPTAPHAGKFTIRATLDADAELPDPNRANNVGTGSAGWITSLVPGVILTEP